MSAASPDLSVPSLRQPHLDVRHVTAMGQIPDAARARGCSGDHVVGGDGPGQGVEGGCVGRVCVYVGSGILDGGASACGCVINAGVQARPILREGMGLVFDVGW